MARALLFPILRLAGLLVSLTFIIKKKKWAYTLLSIISIFSILQFIEALTELGSQSITIISLLFTTVWIVLLVLSIYTHKKS